MTTLSSNIAGVVKPIGMVKRVRAGEVYDVASLFSGKKKKKKKNVAVYEVESVGGGLMLLEKKEQKHTVNGKKGVWRTIRGRHYFFPDDKSGVIPPFKGA